MHNLLPEQQKKKVRWEYRLRLIATVLAFLSFLGIAGNLMLAPAYILAVHREMSAQQELDAAHKEGAAEKNTSAILIDTRRKLDALVNEQKPLQELVTELVKHKESGIQFYNINVTRNEFKERKISVSGIAATRADLIVFSKTFDNDTVFNKINLPVNSFIKEKNIDFTVDITTKK